MAGFNSSCSSKSFRVDSNLDNHHLESHLFADHLENFNSLIYFKTSLQINIELLNIENQLKN